MTRIDFHIKERVRNQINDLTRDANILFVDSLFHTFRYLPRVSKVIDLTQRTCADNNPSAEAFISACLNQCKIIHKERKKCITWIPRIVL